MNQSSLLKQSEEIPSMNLRYIWQGSVHAMDSRLIYASWEYEKEDGSSINTISVSFMHPLDILEVLPRVRLGNTDNTVKIVFSYPPDMYRIRYWPEHLAGEEDVKRNAKYYLNVLDNTVFIPANESGCILQVTAYWPQGNAEYAFYAGIHDLIKI